MSSVLQLQWLCGVLHRHLDSLLVTYGQPDKHVGMLQLLTMTDRINNESYLVNISISFFLFLLGSESSSNSSISFPRNTSWWKSLLRWPSISIFTPFRWSGGRISFSSLLGGDLSLEADMLAGRACTSMVWSRIQNSRATVRRFLHHCVLLTAMTACSGANIKWVWRYQLKSRQIRWYWRTSSSLHCCINFNGAFRPRGILRYCNTPTRKPGQLNGHWRIYCMKTKMTKE